MEDRYLFRGKRIDNGEWVDGHLVADELNPQNYFIAYVYGTDEDKQPHDLDVAMIDKNTICQCTGLRDKNGKLIWENDLVKYHFSDTIAPIRYGSYRSCFDSIKTEHVGFYVDWSVTDKEYTRKDLGYWINMIDAKIVGNIFDNPELLEV